MSNDKDFSFGDFGQIVIAILVAVAMVWYMLNYNYKFVAFVWKPMKLFQFGILAGLEKAYGAMGAQGVVSIVAAIAAMVAKLPVKNKSWQSWVLRGGIVTALALAWVARWYLAPWAPINIGFVDAFWALLKMPFTHITRDYATAYDEQYGSYLRWLVAPFFVWIAISLHRDVTKATKRYDMESLIRAASKSSPHLRPIVPPTKFQKFMAPILAVVAPWRRVGFGENPLNFSHDYDFSKRSDYDNRYAMGVSPTELMRANPPMGANRDELERDAAIVNAGGKSNFRPIAIFSYDKKGKGTYLDFCALTATNSFTRLMLKSIEGDRRCSGVARLYDAEGKIVPLEVVGKDGKTTLVKNPPGGAIVRSGFRRTTLINDGVVYRGPVKDVYRLFNPIERRVLVQIKKMVEGKGMLSPKLSFDGLVAMMVVERHAYTYGVIASIMMIVKGRGKLTGNEFGWIARHDRVLFFMVQSVGRETPFWEASGAWSHYLIEVAAKTRICTPEVYLAVESLRDAAGKVLAAGAEAKSIDDIGADFLSRFAEADVKTQSVEASVRVGLAERGLYVPPEPEPFDPRSVYEGMEELQQLLAQNEAAANADAQP